MVQKSFIKNINKDADQLIQEVGTMKENGVFKKYINSIRFPFFKNFKENSRMDFTFPLTVIVGKNGSGKSSLLHALYGCPKDKSTSRFWFSTATDPIQDGNGKDKRHCFIYSYSSENVSNGEVLKTRASRPGTKTKKANPDYWETGKPLVRYGMDKNVRFSPLKIDVCYLDFRQELSAFDKYFYFGNVKGLKTTKKQDFIRKVSPEINNALTNEIRYRTSNNQGFRNTKALKLSDEELEIASYILDVNYISGKIMEHNFYRSWGYTALLRKGNNQYTEAHAGSGEFSIVKLVHTLHSLEKPTLILLDEPETSLYPGAQSRLLNYLLAEIKRTKSQIVISTHSEKFISHLPANAIKAIHCDKNSNVSVIINNCLSATVFKELEVKNKDIKTIITEDIAAQKILEEIIKREKIAGIKVINIKRGAESLRQFSILEDSLHQNINDFYILDGDQRKTIQNPSLFSQEDYNNMDYITKAVNSIQTKIAFPSGKSKKRNDKQDIIKLKAEQGYLKYFYYHVGYLPTDTPEDIIFDKAYAQELSNVLGVTNISGLNSKDKIFNIVKDWGHNENYYSIFDMFVSNWLKKEDSNYQYIKNLLKNIAEKGVVRGEQIKGN